jgi:cytochrome P450
VSLKKGRRANTPDIPHVLLSAEVDIVRALTWELPALVIFRVLGVPDADVPRVKAWGGNRLVFLFGHTDEPTQKEVAEGMAAFWRYTEDLVAQRTRQPSDDFTSQLVQAIDANGERLAPGEVATVMFGLLLAGHETTTNLLTNATRRFLEHRSTAWEPLCRDAGLFGNAIEEVLRFDPSVVIWRRKTKTAVRIREVDIPAEANLLLLIGSADRDEEVFAAPETFDVRRHNARDHGLRDGQPPVPGRAARAPGNARGVRGAHAPPPRIAPAPGSGAHVSSEHCLSRSNSAACGAGLIRGRDADAQ